LREEHNKFSIFNFQLLTLAVVTIYLAARIWRLTDSCLWFDEIFSVHAAEHSWNSLLSFVAQDLIHPPLFYALLKVWITIDGESLLWLRLFPVLFSVAAIAPFVLLCREFKITLWPRTLALFLLATNGCLIKYAQEVRMYSLLMFLALFSVWLCARFFRSGSGLAALTIVNLLLVYTHYFGWLVIASEIAVVVLYRRESVRRFLASTGLVLAGFLPWMIAVWNAASQGAAINQNIGWILRPSVSDLVQFLLDLSEPFYFQPTSIDAASDYRVSVPILLIEVTGVAAYFFGIKDEAGPEKSTALSLVLLVSIPVAAVFVGSWLLPHSIWGTRHLIIIFPLTALTIAVAIGSLKMPRLKTACVTLIILFTGLGFVNAARARQPSYSWCNWTPIGIEAASRGAAKIYVFEDIAAYHVWFGTRDRALQVIKVRSVPGVNEDAAYFLPRGFDEITTIDLSELRETRFWAAYRAKDLDGAKEPLKPFLEEGYRIVDRFVVPAEEEQTILVQLEKVG
jgi:uncharacterized membrane protein